MSDLIERQKAIDVLDAYQVKIENGEENPYAWARLRMSELPTAEPHSINLNQAQSSDLIERNAVISLWEKYRYTIAVDAMEYDRELRRLLSAELSTNLAEVGTDLISRQQAIDAITEYGDRRNLYMSVGELKRRIEQLPCAEPQIIHCKDCKHYKFADNRAFGFPVKRCEWTGFEDVDDDDFCSRAERRTDD